MRAYPVLDTLVLRSLDEARTIGKRERRNCRSESEWCDMNHRMIINFRRIFFCAKILNFAKSVWHASIFFLWLGITEKQLISWGFSENWTQALINAIENSIRWLTVESLHRWVYTGSSRGIESQFTDRFEKKNLITKPSTVDLYLHWFASSDKTFFGPIFVWDISLSVCRGEITLVHIDCSPEILLSTWSLIDRLKVGKFHRFSHVLRKKKRSF